jgi:hypothetical protein
LQKAPGRTPVPHAAGIVGNPETLVPSGLPVNPPSIKAASKDRLSSGFLSVLIFLWIILV